MDGTGVVCLAVDILPTEFAKEVGVFLIGNLFSTLHERMLWVWQIIEHVISLWQGF